MVAAYVLIKLAPNADLQKVSHAMSEPGVTAVDMILGPWDAVIRCEAADVQALGRLSHQVRSCPGIVDSLTCPVVQLI